MSPAEDELALPAYDVEQPLPLPLPQPQPPQPQEEEEGQQPLSAPATEPAEADGQIDRIRGSVVQIVSTASDFDWATPWNQPGVAEMSGSGFWVQLSDSNRSDSTSKSRSKSKSSNDDSLLQLSSWLRAAEADSESGPVIVTNAHVVAQTVAVSIMIPSLGQEKFGADVFAICHLKDVAMLRIKPGERAKLADMLETAGLKASALQFGDSEAFSQVG